LLRSPAFVILSVLALSCETADEELPSEFSVEEGPRRIFGRIMSEYEPVAGALVAMTPAPLYAHDAALTPASVDGWTAVTDPSGRYLFANAPFRYDLTIRVGADVSVFRGLAHRYAEPSIGLLVPPRAWTARIEPITAPARQGHAVAFFVFAAHLASFSEEHGGALRVGFRSEFATQVTVHAVEYPTERGLAAAVAHGSAEVRVQAGSVTPVAIVREPVAATPVETRFEATPPPGFSLEPAEVVVDVGHRLSAREVARLPAGEPLSIVPFPFGRWTVRVRATREGAVSDSGLRQFDPHAPSSALTLPSPPELVPPVGAPVDLEAIGAAVREHTLVAVDAPAGAVTALRLVTTERRAPLPDLARASLPQPSGEYRWTVTTWPELTMVDGLAGTDARTVLPSATSAPRLLVLP
jgi:hypothetical protein